MRSRVIFFVARLIPSLLGVATISILTRVLTPADYGLYALGLTIIFFLTIGTFEWLGLSVLRMATTAERPDHFFGTVVTCFCTLFALCVILAGAIILVAGLGDYAALVGASLIAAFVSAWVELNQRLQMAELREVQFFCTSVGRAVLSTVLVCSAAYFFKAAPEILIALAISNVVVGLATGEARLNLLRHRFDRAIFWNLLRFGLPLSISVGLATILASVDKWMLQALNGPESVGLFMAATVVSQVPISALAGSLGPMTYSMAVQALEFGSPDAARQQLAQNFTLMLGLIVPAAAGLVAVSANLSQLMVGPLYWHAAVLLAPWLAATAVLSAIRAFYVDFAFQLANQTSPLIWTTLLAVGINIVIDYLLIPGLGQLGAAIGSFGAVLVSLLAATIASRPVFRLDILYRESMKILASSAAMFAVLTMLNWPSGIYGIFQQIAAGLSIYLILSVFLNTLSVRQRLIKQW